MAASDAWGISGLPAFVIPSGMCLAALLSMASCRDDSAVTCGSGTRVDGGRCVPASGPGGGGSGQGGAGAASTGGAGGSGQGGMGGLGQGGMGGSGQGGMGGSTGTGGTGGSGQGGTGGSGQGGGDATSVVTGQLHTCATKIDGSLWCWGSNLDGQLGDGTAIDRTSPVQVAALGSSVAVAAAGFTHTCATKAAGSLWCWGNNLKGQLGDGSKNYSSSPVEAASLGAPVTAVAAGRFHTCAVKGDGSPWCWGYNTSGQIGDGTTVDKTSPVVIASLGSPVVQVSAGVNHTCAIKGDGSLWCWGYNGHGQLGDGSTNDKTSPVQVAALGSPVAAVSAGRFHTCAIKGDGSLWCWGDNTSGQLGDGTIVDKTSPVQVAALGSSVTAVSAGVAHTCAVKSDGSAWCFGYNSSGQLGDGTTADKASPVKVASLGPSVVATAAGAGHSCAIKGDGSAWCWGSNTSGQLGNGSNTSSSLPVQVPGL